MKPQERAELFALTLKFNPSVRATDLADITGQLEPLVLKWLSGKAQPTELDLINIRDALYRAHMTVPRELTRVKSAHEGRVRSWAKKNFSGESSANIVGENVNNTDRAYIYERKLMTLPEIAGVSGKNYQSINSMLKREGVENGESITALIKTMRTRASGPRKKKS